MSESKTVNFNFQLSLEDVTVLEGILNTHIANYNTDIMKVMTGEDEHATVEYYEKLMAYDEEIKKKVFTGIAEQLFSDEE